MRKVLKPEGIESVKKGNRKKIRRHGGLCGCNNYTSRETHLIEKRDINFCILYGNGCIRTNTISEVRIRNKKKNSSAYTSNNKRQTFHV